MTARSLLPTLLALAACASPDQPEAPKETPASLAKTSQALSGVDLQACGLRYVGISDAGCPAAAPSSTPGAGWVVSSLAVPPVLSPVADDLSEYCIYDWEGAIPPEPLLLPSFTPGVSPKPDCHVVGTQGDLTTEMKPFIFGTYINGVARPGSLPPNPDTSVIAVVDTSPSNWASGQPGWGQFEHGRSVAAAARRLSCHNGDCSVDIFPVLGLPRTAPQQIDTVNGGAFGFQSELATGIFDAVELWKEYRSDSRLVINLSVGWEGRFSLIPGSTTPRPSVKMVYDALRYARCHGALIFAAAGNKTYDPTHDDGPLFPAAFADQLAPDTNDCGEIDPLELTDVRANPTDPLVVPVSGVTRYDEPLRNARNHTRTPLQAPGSVISVWDVQNAQMRPALTGSSMSTAAVSAAAATMWAYRPQTPPHVVINQLYMSGVDLGVNADICHAQLCPTARRISMCSALNAVCNQADSLCYGFSATCNPVAAGADFAPAVTPAQRTAMVQSITYDHLEGPFSSNLLSYECKEIDVAYDPGVNSAPTHKCFEDTPGHQLHPWVDPQPDPNGCDICGLVAPWAYIRFFDNPVPFIVTDAVLYLSDGVTTEAYDLGTLDQNLGQMYSGDTYKVNVDPTFAYPLKDGWIEYKVGSVFMTDDVVVY